MSKTKSEVKKIRKKISYSLKHERESKYELSFTKEDASLIARALKIDFAKEKFDLDEFTVGVNIELEHGTKYSECNVTKNDPILTGKIALAHLKEFPDYYTRLKQLEEEAFNYWNEKGLN